MLSQHRLWAKGVYKALVTILVYGGAVGYLTR